MAWSTTASSVWASTPSAIIPLRLSPSPIPASALIRIATLGIRSNTGKSQSTVRKYLEALKTSTALSGNSSVSRR